MKKALVVSAFVLGVSLACFVTDVVTPPPPAIPTFDSNAISTFVVQTAQALALSATAAQTAPPAEIPTETLPAFTATFTLTAAPPTFTFSPSPTNSAAPSFTPAVTVISVLITNTPPPATKTSAPTKAPPTSTSVPVQPSSTSVPVQPSPTSVPVQPSPTNPPSPTATLPAPTATSQPPTAAPTQTPKPSCPQTNAEFEARVIALINNERAKAGLPALNSQSQLTAAAELHSADMACNNYFSHTGRDGSNFSDRARRQGYNMSYGGENIAAGYGSPEDVVKGWMNSPGHRANILGENYVDVGVGYAYSASSSYGSYWTAVFGSQ